jgi:hypothetical protein
VYSWGRVREGVLPNDKCPNPPPEYREREI